MIFDLLAPLQGPRGRGPPKKCRSTPHSCEQLTHQRGSCMVWEINMGVCPRLDFENIMLFNCLGYNFNIYGVFEFLCNSIANLCRHE